MGRRPLGAPRPAPRPYRTISPSPRVRRRRYMQQAQRAAVSVLPDRRTMLVKVLPINAVSIAFAIAHMR